MFATRGPTQAGMQQLATAMRQCGAKMMWAAPNGVTSGLDLILASQAIYVMAAQLAVARAIDPDKPRHSSKVAETS